MRVTRILAVATAAGMVVCLALSGEERTQQAAAESTTTPVLNMQLWDAQKTGWTPGKLQELADMGFTVAQNGYSQSSIPTRSFLDRLSTYGLSFGAYVNTRSLFMEKATSYEKSRVFYLKKPDGTYDKSQLNTFDPAYLNVVSREMKKMLNAIGSAKGLYKVMFNSECDAPISYDTLTTQKAIDAGTMSSGQRIPVYSDGVLVPGRAGVSYPDPCKFLRWFHGWGGTIYVNSWAAVTTHSVYSTVKTTTDPLDDHYDYGQYRNMDILQDWVRVHTAPRDPLSMAYRVERLKANVKRTGGQIWIGPQLGTTDAGIYAAPADVVEEALWLSVAFGARGNTFWGYDAIRRGIALDMDTWSRIKKYHTTLMLKYSRILTAQDAPRKVAVLLSKSNQVLSGHNVWETDNNYEHFFRCLLTAHVPADVLYDNDALSGKLFAYKAVFLPGFGAIEPAVQAKINAFKNAGGRVINWPALRPLYLESDILNRYVDPNTLIATDTPSHLFPHQYRAWRKWEAGRIFATVAGLMDVTCDNMDVIMNVVVSGGTRYVVLVNDKRIYGAWSVARGHRIAEDLGQGTAANVTIRNGSTTRSITIWLPPASMSMIPV